MKMLAVAALMLGAIFQSSNARADPDLDAPPLHVEFSVTAADHKLPLASGTLEMEPQQKIKFATQAAGDPSKIELELYSRIHHDGTVAVWIDFAEVSPKGDRIEWEPAMQGKRGAPMVATIRSGTIERTITLTVK